jgi:hypothetical protein
MAEIFLTSCAATSFQEGLCSIELTDNESTYKERLLLCFPSATQRVQNETKQTERRDHTFRLKVRCADGTAM